MKYTHATKIMADAADVIATRASSKHGRHMTSHDAEEQELPVVQADTDAKFVHSLVATPPHAVHWRFRSVCHLRRGGWVGGWLHKRWEWPIPVEDG